MPPENNKNKKPSTLIPSANFTSSFLQTLSPSSLPRALPPVGDLLNHAKKNPSALPSFAKLMPPIKTTNNKIQIPFGWKTPNSFLIEQYLKKLPPNTPSPPSQSWSEWFSNLFKPEQLSLPHTIQLDPKKTAENGAILSTAVYFSSFWGRIAKEYAVSKTVPTNQIMNMRILYCSRVIANTIIAKTFINTSKEYTDIEEAPFSNGIKNAFIGAAIETILTGSKELKELETYYNTLSKASRAALLKQLLTRNTIGWMGSEATLEILGAYKRKRKEQGKPELTTAQEIAIIMGSALAVGSVSSIWDLRTTQTYLGKAYCLPSVSYITARALMVASLVMARVFCGTQLDKEKDSPPPAVAHSPPPAVAHSSTTANTASHEHKRG